MFRRIISFMLIMLVFSGALASEYEFEYYEGENDDYEENGDIYNGEPVQWQDPMSETATDPSAELITEILDGWTCRIVKWNSNALRIGIPETIGDKTIVEIGERAFAGKLTLRAATLPDSLMSLGPNAFQGCITLETVVLPDTLIEIGRNPFLGCWAMENIAITDNNPAFVFKNGLLYSKNKGELIYVNMKNAEGPFSLPAEIQTIKTESFAGCNGISKVTIPESVTALEEGSFMDCANLAAVEFPAGLANVPGNPFIRCRSLQGFEVAPDHTYLAVIDGVLFSKPDRRLISYPYGLKESSYSIPNGIQCIASEAFAYCDSLKSVEIPDTVQTIGDRAFQGCARLESVVIPESVKSIGDSAFRFCNAIRELVLSENLVSIGDLAFQGCIMPKTMSLPASLKQIGEQALGDCDDTLFTVERDSYAVQYCREYGLMYTYPDANNWLTE